MSDKVLVKSYKAEAAIAASRFVKHGSADYQAIQATDASAPILGVSQQIAAAINETVDAIKAGIAYLELGGNVTRGNILIPDANGKGVAASVVAGTEQHVGAIAEISGVAGDIIPVHVIAGAVIATDTGIATADVTVSSAEILALNAAPKQLVAAPGAGKAIVPVDAQFFLDFAAAAYAGIAAGEDWALKYTDASGAVLLSLETTGFLDATADAFRHAYPVASGDLTGGKTLVANAALVLHQLVGEVITGDSPVKVRVRYRTVDVAW